MKPRVEVKSMNHRPDRRLRPVPPPPLRPLTRRLNACFGVLRQLRQIRRYVSADTFQALVVALVVT